MSSRKSDQETRLHRMAFKLCTRCGKHKTIKMSVNGWKRETKFNYCEKCRKADRERKRLCKS